MSRKNVSDIQVIQAYLVCKGVLPIFPYTYLSELTGEPEKVCYRAMERACRRGYIEYGVSLRSGWVTDAGHEKLRKYLARQEEQSMRLNLTTATMLSDELAEKLDKAMDAADVAATELYAKYNSHNTKMTRKAIGQILWDAAMNAVQHTGISVACVCDETNNPPDVIDARKLAVDLLLSNREGQKVHLPFEYEADPDALTKE